MGTRLQQVLKDKPKCLASINEKPFIDILLDNCINQGLRRFILCVGYLKEQVIEHLSNRNDCEIIFSEEDQPLGTGGALKNAEPFIISDTVLVMNGDSYVKFDLDSLLTKHSNRNASITIIVKMLQNGYRYGSIQLDEKDRITDFDEKGNTTQDWVLINTGVYMINKSVFKKISKKIPFSLEHDFFPIMVEKDIYGYKTKGKFIDIGTPQSLDKASDVIS